MIVKFSEIVTVSAEAMLWVAKSTARTTAAAVESLKNIFVPKPTCPPEWPYAGFKSTFRATGLKSGVF